MVCIIQCRDNGLNVIFYYKIKLKLFSGLRSQHGFSPTAKEMLTKCRRLLESPISENIYAERFKLLLQSEEHQMNIDIRGYDMEVSSLMN